MAGIKKTKLLAYGDHQGQTSKQIKEWISSEFGVSKEELSQITILISSLSEEECSSCYFLLFKKGNKLYEINASHCSCDGYENQWTPEKTSKTYLLSKHCPRTQDEKEWLKWRLSNDQ